MLQNRNLSNNDKKRLLLLATQEIENVDSATESKETLREEPKNEKKNKGTNSKHAPKDTAAFLSLFNDPNGFKFLTHDFDPSAEMTYSQLINSAREAFKNAANPKLNNIPASLYALMNTMLYGGQKDGKDRTWMDCNGKYHTENFACEEWEKWANENPQLHLLSNESYRKIIMLFRSTIRLVLSSREADSKLTTIIERQAKKHKDLKISNKNLDNADFYTYVCYLERGVELILNDMSKYAKEAPDINISYDSIREGDYKLCRIKITQAGSFSSRSIDEVISTFKEGKGDFYTIRNIFSGYCNWVVESKWQNKALRWNILTDTDIEEVEEIADSDISGFTHILTYYSKLK